MEYDIFIKSKLLDISKICTPLTLFHGEGGGGADSTHPQIVLFIDSVREKGESQNSENFPTICISNCMFSRAIWDK